MRKISDTIDRLAKMRSQRKLFVPDAGDTSHLRHLAAFGSNPGNLAARCFVPTDLPRSAPLVVVLHGCTQNAAVYDRGSGWSQLAEQAGFAVLYPEQQRANNPNLCFNWFKPDATRRGSGEVLSIRQMIETMVAAHGIDRQRIFITGLSAGGAMTTAMLATYPEVFAGGGIIAGLAYGTAKTVPEAFDRMRGHGAPSPRALQNLVADASPHQGPWPRISIWQGSADQTVSASNADAIVAQWRDVHGLDKAPTVSEKNGVRTRLAWCDTAGQTKIEMNTVAGMGHGAPIGGDGLGHAQPFMLDVGISSTRETARFWGIAKGVDRQSAAVSTQARSGDPGVTITAPSATRPAEGQHQSRAPKVQQVIEEALRAAGLMR